MSWGKRMKPSIAEMCRDPEWNPLKIPYLTICYRIREAKMTPKEAFSVRFIERESLETFFEKHENPHNLNFWTVKKRVHKMKMSREDAMRYSLEEMRRLGNLRRRKI